MTRLPQNVNRVVKLYYMLINEGILKDNLSSNEIDRLKNELSSKNSKISSQNNEIKEKSKEIEELSLRVHVDYIIFESLSLPKSENLSFEGGNHYIVISPRTAALNLYLHFLMQVIPDQLKRRLLSHIKHDQFTLLYDWIRSTPKIKSVAEQLMGDSFYNTLDYSDVKPYTLSFDELKKIVSRAKERVFDPEKEMEKILKKMEELASKKYPPKY
jgi:Fe-S-cluster formation regulator IscX/YfhJ